MLSYAEDEHSARRPHIECLLLNAARGTRLNAMNPTISDSFRDKRIKTSTQYVPGLTVTIKGVTSDTLNGNEFLVFTTEEIPTEGLPVTCFTKGRQGNYVDANGHVAENRTMRYPQGTAVDAVKASLASIRALAESERTYGKWADSLQSFVGKKIAISGNPYIDQYGTERSLRDFNFV